MLCITPFSVVEILRVTPNICNVKFVWVRPRIWVRPRKWVERSSPRGCTVKKREGNSKVSDIGIGTCTDPHPPITERFQKFALCSPVAFQIGIGIEWGVFFDFDPDSDRDFDGFEPICAILPYCELPELFLAS